MTRRDGESNVVSVKRKERERVRERGRVKKNENTLKNFLGFGICIIKLSEHF